MEKRPREKRARQTWRVTQERRGQILDTEWKQSNTHRTKFSGFEREKKGSPHKKRRGCAAGRATTRPRPVKVRRVDGSTVSGTRDKRNDILELKNSVKKNGNHRTSEIKRARIATGCRRKKRHYPIKKGDPSSSERLFGTRKRENICRKMS